VPKHKHPKHPIWECFLGAGILRNCIASSAFTLPYFYVCRKRKNTGCAYVWQELLDIFDFGAFKIYPKNIQNNTF
jgi:hypothetical protein